MCIYIYIYIEREREQQALAPCRGGLRRPAAHPALPGPRRPIGGAARQAELRDLEPINYMILHYSILYYITSYNIIE